MGERIGHPLENDFDLQIIKNIESWTKPEHPYKLVHPWPDKWEKQKELVEEGCYPLTGTVFEFIDAYSSKNPVKFCLVADQYVSPSSYCTVILNEFKLRKEKGGDPKIIDFGEWIEKDYNLQTKAVKNFACALSKKGIDQNAQNNPLEIIRGIKKFIVHAIFQENKQINPYKFLNYYDLDDAYNFYGRQNETKNAKQKLLERFRSEYHPNILRISGNSGAGKSSFLRAGLLASFQASEHRDDIKTVIFRPTDFNIQANNIMPNDIIRSIIDFFQEQTEINIPYNEVRDICSPYHSSSHRAYLAVQLLAKTVLEATQKKTSKIIFGVDQFEEVVDYLSNKKYAAYWQPLIDFMEVAVQSNTIGIVYTLESSRKKTFKNLDLSPIFSEDNEIEIDGYTSGFLDEIIEQPFRRAGYPLPNEITDKIKKNIKEKLVSTDGPRTEQSILPLLALMLSKLFDYIQDKYPAQDIDSMDSQDIPFENNIFGKSNEAKTGIQLDQTIKDLIEFESLIDKEADQAWQEAKGTTQDDTGAIDHFLQPLVSVGGADFNHLQLRTVAKRPYIEEQKLDKKFENHRLMIPVSSKGFRLVHEAVIRYWSKAWKWFQNKKEFLKKEDIFRSNAKEWSANGKPDDITVTSEAIDLAAEILLVYLRNWSLRTTNDLSEDNKSLCEYCMFLFQHSETPLKPIKRVGQNPSSHVNLAAFYGMIGLLQKFAKINNNCLNSDSPEDGNTPLVSAAWHQKDTVKFLLDQGVKPQKNKHGWPPIAAPIQRGRQDIFQLLLPHTEDKGLYGPDGVNMLHICAEFDRTDMAKVLINSSGLDPNQPDKWNRLPIHRAATHGKIEAFKYFAERSDITSQDQWTQTVLHLAAKEGYVNIVKYLVDYRPFRNHLNRINKNGKTALHLAAENKHAEVVRILLHACNPNQLVQKTNQTPLHLAVVKSTASENSILETVEVLLAHKSVNPNHIDSDGNSSLAIASYLPKVQKKLLRSPKLDPNLPISKSGETPLLICLKLGDWEAFRMMKDRSATIPEYFLDKEGDNVFHLLSVTKFPPGDIAEWVLKEAKADINALNQNKLTPLMVAIANRNWKVVQLLLKQGKIKPSIRDNEKVSALILALHNNAEHDILNELVEISPDLLTDQDYFGWTPLHRAIFCHQTNWIEWLEMKDISSLWEKEDKFNRTPAYLTNHSSQNKSNSDNENHFPGIPKNWDSDLQWRPINDKEREILVKQINPVDKIYTIDGKTDIHAASLSFYDPNEIQILRLSSPSWNKKNLNIYYLHTKDNVYRLSGTSDHIHEVNKNYGILLEAANVLDYLRFFCFFVRTSEGPFFIAEDIGLPEIPSSLTEEERDLLKIYLRPASLNSIHGNNEEFLIIAPVYYSNTLFFADFSVKNSGMAAMIDDFPVVSDLSAHIISPIS